MCKQLAKVYPPTYCTRIGGGLHCQFQGSSTEHVDEHPRWGHFLRVRFPLNDEFGRAIPEIWRGVILYKSLQHFREIMGDCIWLSIAFFFAYEHDHEEDVHGLGLLVFLKSVPLISSFHFPWIYFRNRAKLKDVNNFGIKCQIWVQKRLIRYMLKYVRKRMIPRYLKHLCCPPKNNPFWRLSSFSTKLVTQVTYSNCRICVATVTGWRVDPKQIYSKCQNFLGLLSAGAPARARCADGETPWLRRRRNGPGGHQSKKGMESWLLNSILLSVYFVGLCF